MTPKPSATPAERDGYDAVEQQAAAWFEVVRTCQEAGFPGFGAEAEHDEQTGTEILCSWLRKRLRAASHPVGDGIEVPAPEIRSGVGVLTSKSERPPFAVAAPQQETEPPKLHRNESTEAGRKAWAAVDAAAEKAPTKMRERIAGRTAPPVATQVEREWIAARPLTYEIDDAASLCFNAGMERAAAILRATPPAAPMQETPAEAWQQAAYKAALDALKHGVGCATRRDGAEGPCDCHLRDPMEESR